MTNYYFSDNEQIFDKGLNLRVYAYLLARTAYDADLGERYFLYEDYRKIYHKELVNMFEHSTSTITRAFNKLIDVGLLVEGDRGGSKAFYFPIGEDAIPIECDTLMKLIEIDDKYAVNIYLQLRKRYINYNFSLCKLAIKMGYSDKTSETRKIHHTLDLLLSIGLIDFRKSSYYNQAIRKDTPCFVLLDIKG